MLFYKYHAWNASYRHPTLAESYPKISLDPGSTAVTAYMHENIKMHFVDRIAHALALETLGPTNLDGLSTRSGAASAIILLKYWEIIGRLL